MKTKSSCLDALRAIIAPASATISMLAAGVVLIAVGSACAQNADTIYHGGTIITVNDAANTAEALAVKDGRILAVGSKADLLQKKGDATRVIDLGGKTLIPGFRPPHSPTPLPVPTVPGAADAKANS
jgi:hypothetical protein